MLIRQIKKISFLMLAIILLIDILLIPTASADEKIINELEELSTEIINWKKSDMQMSSKDNLLNGPFLENAGSSSGDWFPIGIGRLGYKDDYDAYLAVINDSIAKRYTEEYKLNKIKATEWHRISLAVLAVGGDPTAMGPDKSIDLIADGTYNRSEIMDIGKQGINGLIWGLLTLDSMRYKIPKDAVDSREGLIERILISQLEDGGFSLKRPPSDVDITGMTLQALAPYYNSEKIYTYTREIDNQKREIRVRDVVDEALEFLANENLDSSESVVQVIVALTALQIDPLSKEFNQDDQTLFDQLKEFQLKDGGFIHSDTYDEENPTSNPDKSNSMASEQTLYGFVSMLRYYKNSRSLYDFREEISEELHNKIKNVESEIDKITDQTDKHTLKTIYEDYLNIPAEEHSYVKNYPKLSDALLEKNIEVEVVELNESMEINSSGKGTVTDLMNDSHNQIKENIFTEADVKRTAALLKDESSEHEVEVIKLISVLKDAENKADYETELTLLENKKQEIDEINKKIEAINQLIVKELYPYESITVKDEATVKQITNKYSKLNEYDQKKIQNYEDVEKAETQINNLQRSKIIKIIGVGLVIILIGYLIYRHKKRKQARAEQKI